MKKVIFLIFFLGLCQGAQAEGFKGKLMFTAKTAYSFALSERSVSQTYYGSELGYFVSPRLLLGLNFEYLRYEQRYYGDYEGLAWGNRDVLIDPHKWYSLGIFTKFFFDLQRFMPFVRLGFGLYVPNLTSFPVVTFRDVVYTTSKGYGRTCFGMSLGAGVQYRVLKGLSLHTEGLVTTIQTRAGEYYAEGRNFTYANLNAGLAVIF